MGWPPEFNQSFRRVRIGFRFERGDWWVGFHRGPLRHERLSLALFGGVLSIITSGTRYQIK